MTRFLNDPSYAQKMDKEDPLSHFKEKFLFPKKEDGKPLIYLCGNSLGLQPVSTKDAILQELEDWKNLGVEGHFNAKNPWMPYHEFLTKQLANITGSKPIEVVAANGLTVNLHLLMVSFYRPSKKRFKILIEAEAFPSDRYAMQSQLKYHGHDPSLALIELKPRSGEATIRQEDIEDLLEKEGDEIALILLGGVNYYTGQLFNMAEITKLGHEKGCVVGFDLAHAIGNVPLKLHDWNIDFACWCSYKYLNSGPGSVAGLYVHEKHARSFDLPRFSGWWGHDKNTRFKMGPEFHPIPGAEGWQLSNPPILSLAAVKASLDIFQEAGMENLRNKSKLLTGYLEFLLNSLNSHEFHIISPSNPDERGCQISIEIERGGKAVFEAIHKEGVICDWREPNCIRLAPVPLYNSFEDVYQFVQIFSAQLTSSNIKAGAL
jgi:kynureninase